MRGGAGRAKQGGKRRLVAGLTLSLKWCGLQGKKESQFLTCLFSRADKPWGGKKKKTNQRKRESSRQRAEGEEGRTWAPPRDLGLADGVRVNERWVSESWGDRRLSISRW